MSPPEGAPDHRGPVVCVVGPTAVGKSGFALEAARVVGAEIISCDSMAVYRSLDIGTDKPSPEERRLVPHHLIDVADPGDTFSAGAFRAQALLAMQQVWSRGRVCMVVGGTGLYYRALMRGLAYLPPRQEALRKRLKERISTGGVERLHRLLARFDPSTAARVAPGDSLRIIRALEVFLTTGKPLSEWIREKPFKAKPFRSVAVGLTAERQHLYDRIEKRVNAMMERGLLDEVKVLRERGLLCGPARKAIGYGELADHLEGKWDLEEAVARIKLRSRHLAKRQLAWFGKEKGIQWFTIEKEVWKNDAIQFIQRRIEKDGGAPRD